MNFKSTLQKYKTNIFTALRNLWLLEVVFYSLQICGFQIAFESLALGGRVVREINELHNIHNLCTWVHFSQKRRRSKSSLRAFIVNCLVKCNCNFYCLKKRVKGVPTSFRWSKILAKCVRPTVNFFVKKTRQIEVRSELLSYNVNKLSRIFSYLRHF